MDIASLLELEHFIVFAIFAQLADPENVSSGVDLMKIKSELNQFKSVIL